jgi:hypothetical protein
MNMRTEFVVELYNTTGRSTNKLYIRRTDVIINKT